MRRAALVALTLTVSLSLAPPASATIPDEAAAQEFVERIEQTLAARDGSYFDERFDMTRMMRKALEGIDASPMARNSFATGFRSSSSLGRIIAANLGEHGSYRFLRFKREPLRAVFRLVSETGVNYHELELAVDRDGEISFDDLYIFAAGENFSQTVRRIFVSTVVAQEQRGLLDRLTGQDVEYLKHLPRIREMFELVRSGEYAPALEIYYSLPASVQSQKELLIGRLQAAAEVSEKELVAACEKFVAEFPDDPALNLLLIDYYYVRERWKETLDTIDRLDHQVGGDPYLQVLRANVWTESGKPAMARRLLESAIRKEPGLEEAYTTMVDVALVAEDFRLISETLDILSRDFGYEWLDLREVPEFAAFCRSPEGKAWLERNSG